MSQTAPVAKSDTTATDAQTDELRAQLAEADTPSCPVCDAWNHSADPLLELSGDGTTRYACCPQCWYRFERFDVGGGGQ